MRRALRIKRMRARRDKRDVELVLQFWFAHAHTPEHAYHGTWFTKAASEARTAIDSTVADSFGDLLSSALENPKRMRRWERLGSLGSVARIVLCDQLGRHQYRDHPVAVGRLDQLALRTSRRLLKAAPKEVRRP